MDIEVEELAVEPTEWGEEVKELVEQMEQIEYLGC